jgi:hypothetical protein
MIECEHKPEWIREREGGQTYCTVCRVTIFKGFIGDGKALNGFKRRTQSKRERENQ